MHSFGCVATAAWSATLVWVGTITMAVGVMYAMVQTDLKRMLAYSTVSQIGYMMLGIGIGTPLAITAGLLHCLNHGFFKGGLFLTAGSVQHATGTRDMNQLGGLAQKMPHTTLSWLIGVGSKMGFPLMSGFASKWMLYAAALQAGWAVPAMVAWAVSLVTVFLGAKATSAVFLGPLTEATKDAHESPPTMLWGMGLLAAGSVVLGVAPQLAVNYLLNPDPRRAWTGRQVYTSLGWACRPMLASFSTTGGLVLAVVSLVLGGVIYALAYASRQTAPATVAVTSGGAAMAGAGAPADGSMSVGWGAGGWNLLPAASRCLDQGRLTAGDFSSIFMQNWRGFFRWSNVDRDISGRLERNTGRLTRPRRPCLLDGAAGSTSRHRICRSGLRSRTLGSASGSTQPVRRWNRAPGAAYARVAHLRRGRLCSRSPAGLIPETQQRKNPVVAVCSHCRRAVRCGPHGR